MDIKKITMLILLLLLVPTGFSLEDNTIEIKPIVKSAELDLFLNLDGSVDATLTLKSVSSIKLFEEYIIKTGVIISDDESIDQKSIQVTDLRNPEIKFTPTGHLNPNTCVNKYNFNVANNDINFCIPSSKDHDFYYQVKYKYEAVDYPTFETCLDRGVVGRQITFSLSPQDKPYFASISLSADKNLLFNTSNKCPNGWKKVYTDNGYKCVNKNLSLPSMDLVYFLNTTISGIKKSYLAEKKEQEAANKQEEFEELQKKNIQASIDANKRSIWNIILTFALVIITAIYAGVAHKTWKEMKRSNIPLVSAKLDSLGISAVVLNVINIGNSAARNIKLVYSVEPNGPSGEWKHHLLQKDDFARLVLEDNDGNSYSLQNFVNKFNKINIISKFEDIHKESHEDEFEINLVDYRKSIKDNSWIWDTTFKDDIEQISKKVKELSDTLKTGKIKIDIKNVDLNPSKVKSELNFIEKLLKEMEKKLYEFKKKKYLCISRRHSNSFS